MLAFVPALEAERQPSECPACAKRQQHRANAARNFATFEARFGTSGVSRRQLRAVFAAHADPQLVEALLILAWNCHWSAQRIREVTKSLNLKRCASGATRCWLHRPIVVGDLTPSCVAACDAKGVLHVAD
jgi:hypothetical protein